VRDSTFYRNQFRGLEVAASNVGASMEVENVLVAENPVGLFASTSGAGVARMRVARSTIVGNTFLAIEAQTTSMILSRGDNTLADNAAAEAFTGTYLPK
jgi:hypothetical protein